MENLKNAVLVHMDEDAAPNQLDNLTRTEMEKILEHVSILNNSGYTHHILKVWRSNGNLVVKTTNIFDFVNFGKAG